MCCGNDQVNISLTHYLGHYKLKQGYLNVVETSRGRGSFKLDLNSILKCSKVRPLKPEEVSGIKTEIRKGQFISFKEIAKI